MVLGAFEIWRIGDEYWAVCIVGLRPIATKGPFSQREEAIVAAYEAQHEVTRRLREAGILKAKGEASDN